MVHLGGLAASSLRPNNEMMRETEHSLSGRFRLHHLFLRCATTLRTTVVTRNDLDT